MRFILAAATIFLAFHAPARAEDKAVNCTREYEQAAYPYWMIVNDILRFKTMFDNYDRLCSQHYPDDIAALQPAADLLRKQTAQDVKDADAVIRQVFDTTLPGVVAPSCATEAAARDRVRKNMLAAMKKQSRTIGARLEKSALTIRNPDVDLKLCRDLKPLSKKVIKALGPGLDHPLFEMSLINSKFVTRDARHRKDATATYREILRTLDKDAD